MAQFTTAQVAEKFGTTPRTLRKFLRADARANNRGDTLPGKGSRYMLPGKDLAPLKRRFNAWNAAELEARAARAAQVAAEAKVEVEAPEVEGEVEDFDALENPMDA